MANPASTQTAPTGGGARKWILLIVAVALMAAAGAATAVYLLTGRSEAKAPPPPPPPVFVAMDPFTVNLTGEESERFLHIGLSLKVQDSATQARITQHMPEVRSRVLLLLSSKQTSELTSIDGKRHLASEIRTLIGQPFAANLPAQTVNDVLFTAFVIQ